MKLPASFISFVKRSARFFFPSTKSTFIVLSCINSLTAFLQIWMYLRPFVVKLLDHATQALLSLYIGIVWDGVIVDSRFHPLTRWLSVSIYFVHLSMLKIHVLQ